MIEICDIISREYSYEVFICYPKKACIANTSKENAEIDRAKRMQLLRLYVCALWPFRRRNKDCGGEVEE